MNQSIVVDVIYTCSWHTTGCVRSQYIHGAQMSTSTRQFTYSILNIYTVSR